MAEDKGLLVQGLSAIGLQGEGWGWWGGLQCHLFEGSP